MFWVTTAATRPARSKRAMARCVGLGLASRIWGHTSSFWSQYSTRAAALAMNSPNSTGRRVFHRPSGPR